jgi:hypothetical protein
VIEFAKNLPKDSPGGPLPTLKFFLNSEDTLFGYRARRFKLWRPLAPALIELEAAMIRAPPRGRQSSNFGAL